MSKKVILVAVGQLVGAVIKEGSPDRHTLDDGAQLTKAAQKAFGLSDADVASLKEAGKLIEVPVRADAEDASNGDAERIKALEGEVGQLKTDLKTAQDAAGKAADDLKAALEENAKLKNPQK